MKLGWASTFSPITSTSSVYDINGDNLETKLDKLLYHQPGELVSIHMNYSIGWAGSQTVLWFRINLPKLIKSPPKSFSIADRLIIAGNSGDILRSNYNISMINKFVVGNYGGRQILASIEFKNNLFNISSRIVVTEAYKLQVQF